MLARFYRLFESIATFTSDYNKYLDELEAGYYIQHTLEGVLMDTDGRQLLAEGLYLYGVMLILLDLKVPGPVRERLLVAHYRHKGEGAGISIVDLSRFCRCARERAPRRARRTQPSAPTPPHPAPLSATRVSARAARRPSAPPTTPRSTWRACPWRPRSCR